jgi:hypothetical protein
MFRGQDPATGEQRCHPLLRADPRSKLPAGPLLITALPGNRIRWHEVAKWLPEKQAKHTRQVADLALWEPEVGFEPTTFRLRVGCATTTPLGPGVVPNRSARSRSVPKRVEGGPGRTGIGGRPGSGARGPDGFPVQAACLAGWG